MYFVIFADYPHNIVRTEIQCDLITQYTYLYMYTDIKHETIRLIHNAFCKICFVPCLIQIIIIAQEHAYTCISNNKRKKNTS